VIRVNSRSLALTSLLGGLVILGFAAIFVKWSDAPGPVTALYRMLIGAGTVTPVILLKERRSFGKLPRRGVLMAMIGGALFGCDMAIWMTAIGLSGATMPTLMANTAPLWVGIGSILILRERKAPGFWAGVLIAISGVILVFSHNLGAARGLGGGMVLGLVAALFYASFHLATQIGRRYLSTLTYLWISTICAAGVLFIINLALRLPLTGFGPRTWLSFVALGLIVQFLGWFLINYAQGFLRASIVAPVLLGQPVLTALLAVPLLRERLNFLHVIGGLMVLSGVYIVIRGRNMALRTQRQGRG
jgi:drug/metabolite transporter (DMT)-like permease